MLCLVSQHFGELLPTVIFLYFVVWHTERNLLGLLAELAFTNLCADLACAAEKSPVSSQ
jgi:hypothetical protein